MPGCGTQPDDPRDMVAWLDVPDMGSITVDTVEVPYHRAEVSCDHAQYPP